MELKDYQARVIADLVEYLEALERTQNLAEAFKEFWDGKGATRMDAYKDNISGVPHVCAKVPTAGGKTFIAVNALDKVFGAITRRNPKRPKLVVWLVPSLTILDQTFKHLSDPEHPYRKRLNQLFRHRVAVFEKKDLLMGAGFSLDSAAEQLSIVVMSFDSLRARKKEDRKIFQENGYLASFANMPTESAADWLLPGHDPTALINVIRGMQPVVVVDESHNAESELSVEMLQNLNPGFILDLTATPRNNSNIISYVDALALKRQHMVKLPVIVTNRSSKTEVVENALSMQRQLETIAMEEEAKGGKYIRPIVLFQAEPKTKEDNETFEKLRATLVNDLKIPPEQIAIKTASVNELKGVDLASRSCPIRFIITVNALKEGWDCPFAYVLASLADKSSAVDVEQILGRILRMPHVQLHGNDLLNMSYVFTASNRFSETLDNIVKGLNRAGFSSRDHRVIDATVGQTTAKDAPVTQLPLGTNPSGTGVAGETTNEADDDLGLDRYSLTWQPLGENSGEAGSAKSREDVIPASAFVAELTQRAVAENQAFEEQAKNADSTIPPELEEKMNRHMIKDPFREEALSLRIPQFFTKVESRGFLDEDWQLAEYVHLLKDFRLTQADANIPFDDIDAEMVQMDLEEIGKGNYAPKAFVIDAKERRRINELILSHGRESQVRDVTHQLMLLVGNMYPMEDAEVRLYIARVVGNMDDEQLRDCLERRELYASKIKSHIKTLSKIHARKVFNDKIDVNQITVRPHFAFAESIVPAANSTAVPNSLYVSEASMNGLERRVIERIANLQSVEWWHRNIEKKGFRLNGFINHYPDFIIKTKVGTIILLETKGGDRDNSDSEMKLKLGKFWEKMAGPNFKYLMVFDSNPIEGADTFDSAIKKIEQL